LSARVGGQLGLALGFGRPGTLGPAATKGDEVLCTNPANLGGGSGVLNVIQPSAPFAPGSTIALGLSVLNWHVPTPSTVFWASPGSFTARCENSNGAHVLEINARHGAQTPTPAPGSDLGPAPPGRQRRAGQPDRRRQVRIDIIRQHGGK
jgi:hypothetical protein